MKNSQKGSAVPYLIAIIALLIIAGVVYIYKQQHRQTILDQALNNESVPTTTNDNNVVKPISVIYPKGGESLVSGQKVNIEWTTPGYELTKNVNIYLLRTDETATSIIAKNTPNSGSYQWTIPTVTVPISYLISVHIPAGDGEDSIDNPYSASSGSFTVSPVQASLEN